MRLSRSTLRRSLELSRKLFESERVSLATKRRLVDVVAGVTRPPRGTGVTRDVVGRTTVELIRPPLPSYNGTMLYLHGGGYAMGSVPGYRGYVARLALTSGVEAIVPEYPLAPEHPYPRALDDMVDLYRTLVSSGRIDPTRTALVGDSAGGGLALALAERLRDQGLPLPSVLGLVCPWLDLTVDVAGTRPARHDPLLVPALISAWVHPYVGSADAADPGISPLLGNLDGLPPVVLHSAGLDPLCADSERLAAALGEHRVSHVHYPDLWHDFHLQVGVLSEAADAVADLGSRLRAALQAVTPDGQH